MKVNSLNNYPVVTPTLWQMVVLRNVGLVKNSIIAKTLNCSTKVLKEEICKLGLEKIKYNPQYRNKSYITIIRNNWQILPNEQIIALLEMSEEDFEFELKENDFLFVKLGEKPHCENVVYTKLTKEQEIETRNIKKIISKNYIHGYAKPFDFNYHNYKIVDNNKLCIVHPYSASVGDSLLLSSEIVSEKELRAMKNAGINGLWVQGLLSKLSYYPFDGYDSKEYIIRIANLNKFIKKAKSYGIGVYIYLNEPRSIMIDKLSSKYSHLKGRQEDNQVALCISQKEVQDYLYEAVKSLVISVPLLEGIITITSSENLTHCKHTLGSTCEKCESYHPYELAVMINNIMEKAIEDSSSKCKLIANLWGWAPYCGFTFEDVKQGIKALNPNIAVLCVSEFGTHIKNGHTYSVGEYSISHGEPCLETIEYLNYAKSLNRKIMSKIQVNNSWEMSSIPYIPVYECIIEHLKKLNELGVNDLMASWTLGGYPSANISLLSSYSKGFDYDKWLKKLYGDDSKAVKEAVHCFSKAFKSFPFDINTLYFSPLHLGPANPYFEIQTGFKASMVGFPYDDYKSWINVSDEKEIIGSFKALLKGWKKGLKILQNVDNDELKSLSEVFYINVDSFVNQFMFYSGKMNKDEFIKRELKNSKNLYRNAAKYSIIGFEASNHYLYVENSFLEKIIALSK